MNARVPLGLKPGIHSITADEYHADPAETPSLSNSLMTTLLQKTPLHAWREHPRLNPHYAPRAAAEAFDLGTAAHSVLLEGADVVTIIDAEDWRTKAAKEARAEARAAGRIPMLPPQAAAVTAMTVAANEFIASSGLAGILERGKSEQTIIWKDGSVLCRARLDFLADDHRTILDYKSTAVDRPGDWMRKQIVAHGYDTQAVFYPRGLAALGYPGARLLFLVQEVVAPYFCYLVEPAESMAELGNRKVARALRLWRECLSSNNWFGYPASVHQAEAPLWALQEEEALA